MNDKIEEYGQPACPKCGGAHFGTGFDACPYTKSPCVICGTPTIYACSDCRIDTGKSVHVCGLAACQETHEASHNERPAPGAPGKGSEK